MQRILESTAAYGQYKTVHELAFMLLPEVQSWPDTVRNVSAFLQTSKLGQLDYVADAGVTSWTLGNPDSRLSCAWQAVCQHRLGSPRQACPTGMSRGGCPGNLRARLFFLPQRILTRN